MAQLVKTMAGLAIASCKTVNGLAIASVKTVAGLDNTASGGGAFTFVSRTLANSSAEASAEATTISKTVTGISAGSLVVVWVKGENTTVATLSVSDGTSSLTGGTKTEHANGELRGQFFYITSSVASGSVTYTATYTGGSGNSFRSMIVMEFTYTGTCAFDTQATNQSASSTAVTSTSMTTSADTNHVVIGGYGEFSNATLSSALVAGAAADGLFQLSATNFTGMWRKTFTSGTVTGAATATLSSAQPWICNGIAFKSS